MNISIFYHRVTVLRASPVSVVSQNNQPQIFPMPKKYILRRHILLVFTTVPHILDKVTIFQRTQPTHYFRPAPATSTRS